MTNFTTKLKLHHDIVTAASAILKGEEGNSKSKNKTPVPRDGEKWLKARQSQINVDWNWRWKAAASAHEMTRGSLWYICKNMYVHAIPCSCWRAGLAMVQLPSHSPFLFSSDERFHHKEGEVLSSILKRCPRERKKENTVWRKAIEEQQSKSLNFVWRDGGQHIVFPVRPPKTFHKCHRITKL